MSTSTWLKRLASPRARISASGLRRNDQADWIRLSLTRLEERRVLDAMALVDGAALVADLNPGPADATPADATPAELTPFNGGLYFSASGQDDHGTDVGRELFQLDDSGETSLVADIQTGSANSDPGGFTEFGGNLYFAATGDAGRELYKLDGDGVITRMADINPGLADSNPGELAVVNGELYFAATGSDGRELYKVNVSDEVHQVADIFPGGSSSNPADFTESGDRLFFVATQYQGREVFELSPSGNVQQVSHINWAGPEFNPRELVDYGDSLYFTGNLPWGRTFFQPVGSKFYPLWVLGPVSDTDTAGFTEYNGNLYFRSTDQLGNGRLLSMDANRNVSSILTQDGEQLASAAGFTSHNGSLYFSAETANGRGLFRLNGHGNDVQVITIDLPPGVIINEGDPTGGRVFAGLRDTLYFGATGPLGTELYYIDANDRVGLAADLHFGTTSSHPSGFAVFGDALYFAAETSAVGRELYRTVPIASNVAIVDSELHFTDVTGKDNRLVVFVDGDYLYIRDDNGHPISASIPNLPGHGTAEIAIPISNLAGISHLNVDTNVGSDSLSLYLTSDSVSLPSQFETISFYAGSNLPSTAGDVMRLIGDERIEAVVVPDALVTGAGRVALSGMASSTSIDFFNVESIDVTRMSTVSLIVPETDTNIDVLTIRDGLDALTSTESALVVSGSTGGRKIQNVHFFDNATLMVDTGTGHAAHDHITIASASSDYGIRNLLIDTGSGGMINKGTVAISGDVVLTGGFVVRTDRLQVDANVTAGRVSLESTEDIWVRGAITSLDGHVEILADNDIVADHHGDITSSESVRLVADRDQDGSGTIQFSADITMGSGFTTFDLSAEDGFFSGSLSGPGGFIKQGQGKLELTATSLNTYQGTTQIQSGELVVNGTIGSDAAMATLTVGPAATLSGDGWVNGSVTVLSGGKLAPGVGPGVLRTGRLDLQTFSQFTVDITGPNHGTDYDRLDVHGDVSLVGAHLVLYGPAQQLSTGTLFVLIDNFGGKPILGNFLTSDGQVIPEGGEVTGNGFSAILSYSGGQSRNDVTLTVVNDLPIFFIPPLQPQHGSDSDQLFTGIFALSADFDRTEFGKMTAAPLIESEMVRTPDSSAMIEFERPDLEEVERARLRVFFRVYDDALQEEGIREYELQPNDIGDPLGIFHRHRFPNGHYKVYVLEPGARHPRLVLDVHVYDGKVVPTDYREADGDESSSPARKEFQTPEAAAEDAIELDKRASQTQDAGVPVHEPIETAGRLNEIPQASMSTLDVPVAKPAMNSSHFDSFAASLAGTAAVYHWRVRVQDALNSTIPDKSRAARLIRRIGRRAKSVSPVRPQADL